MNTENNSEKIKDKVTFVDLFAGAGGFSEGFLQAETDTSFYEFILASDINENCELTHLARYNYQLGLNMNFLRQDITEPDFLENLVKLLNGREIDVVCGGPPCQSFSLAGKRKKFDKKDDLFSHYLDVIKMLKPKYFVMENVKGILTKEDGKICKMIIDEIRSIIDIKEYHKLIGFITELRNKQQDKQFLFNSFLLRFQFEIETNEHIEQIQKKYIQILENRFTELTPKIADYKTSRTNKYINTIRHGFNLLKRNEQLQYIRNKVIIEKSMSDVDNDLFVKTFDEFLTAINTDTIIDTISEAFQQIQILDKYNVEVAEIVLALNMFHYSIDECISELKKVLQKTSHQSQLNDILLDTQLYNIEKPFVALASNYGVPQDRERVLFIGCRKDQKLITEIPPTVTNNEKVTVFEALYDLDFIDGEDEISAYKKVNLKERYNGTSAEMAKLIKKRRVGGALDDKDGLTFSDWSKIGRLNGRFKNMKRPFYVRNIDDLKDSSKHKINLLQNHQISKHSEDVKERLNIIRQYGDYSLAKKELAKAGLDSDKRNYSLLRPDSQSPTIMTIPDDYIHFSRPRALTVREMARLQSFDDSFVFQGKRTTGGKVRKQEVPQFTLVGNAVPPLLARAVALEILNKITK